MNLHSFSTALLSVFFAAQLKTVETLMDLEHEIKQLDLSS